MSNVIQTLRERGLLRDVTDPALEELAGRGPIAVYVGFDPTADSLHIGNMVGIMVLKHFQLAGHRAIALAGGGTGMIGDPSGKSTERNLLTPEQLAVNLAGIKSDLSRFLDFGGANAALLLNNADWLAGYGFIDFLRDVGKHFRMGDMLAKDSVRTRLDSESGMSFTEFSYMLLQAYDFKHLFEKQGCVLQSGGSDQWGNITAGIELIRRTLGKQAFGMTTPLLVDAAGNKMGKSAGGAIWLNGERRSPYEFYQFWIQREDSMVESYLKMMTLLPLEKIAATMVEHAADASRRVAQRALAHAVTAMVHGAAEADKARDASEALFGGRLEKQSDAELRGLFQDVPSVEIPRADLDAGLAMVDLVTRAGLAESKKEAKRLLSQGGVYLNNSDVPVGEDDRVVTAGHLASDTMLILRAGKKKYCLVGFV